MNGMRSQAASSSGHPRLEPDDQPSLQESQAASSSGHPRPEPDDQPSLQQIRQMHDSRLDQRNRWTRRILLGIVAALAVATLLAGIRW